MGLSRVPSFSDRPGFPSGLRVRVRAICNSTLALPWDSRLVHLAHRLNVQVLVVDSQAEALDTACRQLTECSYEGAPWDSLRCPEFSRSFKMPESHAHARACSNALHKRTRSSFSSGQGRAALRPAAVRGVLELQLARP